MCHKNANCNNKHHDNETGISQDNFDIQIKRRAQNNHNVTIIKYNNYNSYKENHYNTTISLKCSTQYKLPYGVVQVYTSIWVYNK